MENASEALVMAGAVLIFIIALTVSMSSFTTMRSQIDEITQSETKLDLVTDGTNYLNYDIAGREDVRTVGVETVVSSMYRVAKENYIVYLFLQGTTHIDSSINQLETGNNAPSATLEEKEKYYEHESAFGIIYTYYDKASNSWKEEEPLVDNTYKCIKVDINGKNSDVTNLLSEDGKKLYDVIKDKQFKEYLGVYQENTNADEVNRTTYRVITYIEQ